MYKINSICLYYDCSLNPFNDVITNDKAKVTVQQAGFCRYQTVTVTYILPWKMRNAVRIWGNVLLILLVAAAVLFVAFFPYASGVMVSQKWLDAMNWFRGWLWY